MSYGNGHSNGSNSGNHGKKSKNGGRDDSYTRGDEYHSFDGHHDNGRHNNGHHDDDDHGNNHGHGKGHGYGHDHHHHHGHGHGHDGEGQNGVPTAVDDAAAVQEDLTLAASGNVLANDTDPDAGDSKTVVAVEGAAGNVGTSVVGLYGTLIINADGSYNYTLNNGDAAVQSLAEGEQVTDTFSYTMADGAGATSTANLVITVDGTNDAPVIAEGGDTTGAVTEDSVLSVSGDLDATDVDHGAVIGWTLQGGAPGEVAQDVIGGVEYTFAIDQLTVVKNGTTIFDDDFGDDVPPPSGVLFSNGNPGTYGTIGAFTESGGRAIMDGSLAGPTQAALFTSIPYLGHFATLQTNASDDPANINLGLKNDDDFTVQARFDLTIPDENGEAYGIRLSDRGGPTGQPGDDVMELLVRRDGDGVVRVAFRERDFAAGEITGIESIGLTPPAGTEQILLRLSHEAANIGVVTASFDYLDNLGAVIGTHTFANTGQIFGTETPGNTADDEVWTRAQIVAFSPGEVVSSSLVGNYGTMTINQNGEWTYQLDNDSPQVQALAAGEQVVDSFTAVVADEFGASDTENIDVTVTGVNDAPVIADGGDTTGAVTEDAVLSASGDLDATDVDNGAVLGWTLQGGAPGEVTQDVISGVEYTFAIDQLTLVKNGTTIFDDDFGDDVPPPSGVLFSNGNPGTYGTSGIFTESGGRAIMDGSLAGPTQSALFTSIPYLGHFATLQTNASDDPANINLGLKIDDDFAVEARFDLTLPDENGEAYGIRLSDRGGPTGQPGDDVMELLVRGDGGGGVRVVFHERDFAAGEVTGIQSIGLTPPAGAEQILLRLSHEAANTGVVTASFDYLDNLGGVIGTHTFANTGQIFGTETPGNTTDDEVWTRAQVVAFSPGEVVSSSLVGNYGTMTINQNGEWTYQLDNDSPQVQALAAGEQVVDSFTALVADEFGASDTEIINITINGADDAPTTTTVSFYADANNIEEGNPLPFYFHRDVTDAALDVRYTVGTFPASGATPGDDFTSAGTTFTEVTPGVWSDPTMIVHFDPGQSDAVLVFDTIYDGVVEQFGEAFTVNFDFANNDPHIIFDGAQSEADYLAAFPLADPTQVNIGHIIDV